MTHPGESMSGDTGEGAAPSWVLRSAIDAARLDRVHDALTDAICAWLMSGRASGLPDRWLAPLEAHRARTRRLRGPLLAALPWLCVAGLALALAFSASGGIVWGRYRVDLVLVLYFGAGLVLNPGLRRLHADPERPLAWRPPQWTWLWNPFAGFVSWGILRAARRAAPFEARYVFDGRTVTYTRVTPVGASLAWQRTLEGWRMSGTGFTLVLKRRHSLDGVIFLHKPNARLGAWLAGLGIEPICPVT